MSTPTPRNGNTLPPRSQEPAPWTQQQPESGWPRGDVQRIVVARSPDKEPWGRGRKIAVILLALLVIGGIWWQIDAGPKSQDTATIQPSTSERAAAPEATTTVGAEQSAEPTAPAKVKYKAVTSQEWRKIAKNPDAHIGEAIVLYGYVTKADGATGENAVYVNADSVRHRGDYGYLEYEINAVLSAGEADFSDFVEDDIFKIKGVIAGGFDYETTLGDELTAPLVTVNSLDILGSTT